MNIYPSHRDFAESARTCERAKKNAANSELVDDGKGVTGIAGAIPFPFPKSGLEAVWNVGNAGRMYSEHATFGIADVYPNGTNGWGRGSGGRRGGPELDSTCRSRWWNESDKKIKTKGE